MNRNFNFILVLILLVTLSNVDAFVVFKPCDETTDVLSVSVFPDPLVGGKTAEFTVSGQQSRTITPAVSTLRIGIFDVTTGADPKLIAEPFEGDICKVVECPIKADHSFKVIATYALPKYLPPAYVILVILSDIDITESMIVGCAIADVGPSDSLFITPTYKGLVA